MPHYSLLCVANSKASLRELSTSIATFLQTLERNGGVCRGVTDYGLRPLAFRMKAHLNYHYTGRFVNISMQANPQLMQHILARVLADEKFVRGFVTKLKTLHSHGSYDLDGQEALNRLPSVKSVLTGLVPPAVFDSKSGPAATTFSPITADADELIEKANGDVLHAMDNVVNRTEEPKQFTDRQLDVFRGELDLIVAQALVATNLISAREVRKMKRHFDPKTTAPEVILENLSDLVSKQREENLESIERYERARKAAIEDAERARLQWKKDEDRRAVIREREFHMRLARKHALKILQGSVPTFDKLPNERKETMILNKSERIVKKWMQLK
jgi:ribosomal protein S6